MIELADIFARHGPEYLAKYGPRMLPSHRRAMRDIINCRTPVMGGKTYRCKQCGKLDYSYHSCKNRSCPKCANEQTTAWLEKQKALLLPVKYFMVTCTLPALLRPLARSRQKTIYSLLMQSFAAALQKLALDPRHLGGRIGMVGVLQTWARNMSYHVHTHFIVPAGGLSPDGKIWLNSRYNKFLVPEKPLGIIFRAKFRDALKKTGLFHLAPAQVWKQNWVVDCEPVGTAQEALKYLAPYIYRVAIANNRIEKLENGCVTFRYRRSDSQQFRRRTLPAEKFISCFLQHVLPKGFQKVRYYGLLSPKNRHLLNTARKLLGFGPYQKPQPKSSDPDKPHRNCPHCGGQLLLIEIIHHRRSRAPP